MSSFSQPQREGIFYGLSAFLLWGVMPIYFKSVAHVPPLEVLGHRVFWSFVFTALLMLLLKRGHQLRTLLANRRQVSILALTSCIIGFNWLLFIWAVANEHMVEASLGYFINPLVNMLFGFLFLGERMTRIQTLAVSLAVAGVGLDVVMFGRLPWVALALAISFGLYSLLRKQLKVDSMTGMLVETAVLVVPALAYLTLVADSSTSDWLANDWSLNVLLMLAGPATTIPLMLYAAAAVRLRLTTLGFIQYISPSLMFLLATQIYGETITQAKWITFLLIWAALVLFSLHAALLEKRRRAVLDVVRAQAAE